MLPEGAQDNLPRTSSQDFLFTSSLIPIFMLSYNVHVTFTQQLTTYTRMILQEETGVQKPLLGKVCARKGWRPLS